MVSYSVEVGEEAEGGGAADPEWQEVFQLGMGRRLKGSTREGQGTEEWVDLVLGQRT